MIEYAGRSRSSAGRWVSGLVFLILVLAGICLNLYLLSWRVADAGIAGCGGGSCEEVLASRWSEVFGVPVTVIGALVYAGLLVSLTSWDRRLTLPLLGAILGAVFWFVFVQAVFLGKFCPWCLAAHGVGLAVVIVGVIRRESTPPLRNLALWGYAAFLAIGLMQIYGPVQASHRVNDAPNSAVSAPVHASGSGRKVFFDEGRKSFDVSAHCHALARRMRNTSWWSISISNARPAAS